MICDLAETYHILNYRGLPSSLVATLVIGLRDDSRVKMKLSGSKVAVDQLIAAMVCDAIQFIAWSKTKEAARGGRYNQKSVVKMLRGEYEKDEVISFSSPEEYEKYMKQFER